MRLPMGVSKDSERDQSWADILLWCATISYCTRSCTNSKTSWFYPEKAPTLLSLTLTRRAAEALRLQALSPALIVVPAARDGGSPIVTRSFFLSRELIAIIPCVLLFDTKHAKISTAQKGTRCQLKLKACRDATADDAARSRDRSMVRSSAGCSKERIDVNVVDFDGLGASIHKPPRRRECIRQPFLPFQLHA